MQNQKMFDVVIVPMLHYLMAVFLIVMRMHILQNFRSDSSEHALLSHKEDVPIEGEFSYALRYEEFIALNTAMIQQLIQRVHELESKLRS